MIWKSVYLLDADANYLFQVKSLCCLLGFMNRPFVWVCERVRMKNLLQQKRGKENCSSKFDESISQQKRISGISLSFSIRQRIDFDRVIEHSDDWNCPHSSTVCIILVIFVCCINISNNHVGVHSILHCCRFSMKLQIKSIPCSCSCSCMMLWHTCKIQNIPAKSNHCKIHLNACHEAENFC